MPITRTAVLLASAALSVACSSAPTAESGGAAGTTTGAPLVLSVIPSGGATSVDPASPITIVFGHPMMAGMEFLVVLHEGSITGSQVAGAATWSSDRSKLTFTPTAPLHAKTKYVLHFSPNVRDTNGNTIDWSACAGAVGGQSVPASMFGGGMMGGTGMGGTGMGAGMMGAGWQAGNGTWGYGMYLTFTTT